METSTPKRPASSKPGQPPPPYTTSLAEGVRKLDLGKSATGSRPVPPQQSSEWCPLCQCRMSCCVPPFHPPAGVVEGQQTCLVPPHYKSLCFAPSTTPAHLLCYTMNAHTLNSNLPLLTRPPPAAAPERTSRGVTREEARPRNMRRHSSLVTGSQARLSMGELILNSAGQCPVSPHNTTHPFVPCFTSDLCLSSYNCWF